MNFDPTSCLDEVKNIVSARTYYKSAKVKLALVRADGQVKPLGGYVILSDQPGEQTRTLDYETLVLMETSLTPKEFCEWLTRLVSEGNGSLAGLELAAKGGFEQVNWPFEGFMPSGFEYFPLEWGSDFYKFKFSAQASLPGPLPLKAELPLYPDGPTAWAQWMKLEPIRMDMSGRIFILLPNMIAKIERVTLSSKSIRVSITPGKGDFSSLRGKLFVQETYTGFYHPSVNSDLTFPNGTAEVPLSFKPGMLYLTLSSKDGDLVDLRRSYLNYPSSPGIQLELTSEELQRIIDQGENETTEFKLELSRNHLEFAETMVAFSNLRGGLILLGVDEHGEVKGLQDPDPEKMEERIQNFGREFCDPPLKFTLRRVDLQGKSVIVVEVPEGSAKPYWLKNRGPMVRSGSTDRVMTRVESQQSFTSAKGPFG